MQSHKVRFQQRVKSGAVEVEFSKVIADSRCPQGEECYWPGIFVAEIQVRAGDNKKTVLIGSRDGKSVVVGASFDSNLTEYRSGSVEVGEVEISLDSVVPPKVSGKNIDESQYVLSLSVAERSKVSVLKGWQLDGALLTWQILDGVVHQVVWVQLSSESVILVPMSFPVVKKPLDETISQSGYHLTKHSVSHVEVKAKQDKSGFSLECKIDGRPIKMIVPTSQLRYVDAWNRNSKKLEPDPVKEMVRGFPIKLRAIDQATGKEIPIK